MAVTVYRPRPPAQSPAMTSAQAEPPAPLQRPLPPLTALSADSSADAADAWAGITLRTNLAASVSTPPGSSPVVKKCCPFTTSWGRCGMAAVRQGTTTAQLLCGITVGTAFHKTLCLADLARAGGIECPVKLRLHAVHATQHDTGCLHTPGAARCMAAMASIAAAATPRHAPGPSCRQHRGGVGTCGGLVFRLLLRLECCTAICCCGSRVLLLVRLQPAASMPAASSGSGDVPGVPCSAAP